MPRAMFRLTLLAMAPAIPVAGVVIYLVERDMPLRQAVLEVARMWAELYRFPF